MSGSRLDTEAAGRIAPADWIAARRRWSAGLGGPPAGTARRTCEGGCGVIGVIGSEPLAGRHLHRPLAQMNNRGNGKGGGLALAGCFPERPDHFALQIGLIDAAVRGLVEREYVEPLFTVDAVEQQPHLDDPRQAGRLRIRPPDVVRYFVRARTDALEAFCRDSGLPPGPAAEAELVSRNSQRLNRDLYSGGPPRAFVMSHGRNLMILKAVGFAEDILRYYRLEEFQARVWIGHQRYPTRGRVWHPGGAHPFAGLDEALVHNGDLANYAAIVEHLGQKGIEPLFATDTEVAALLFDLYHRVYGYPLEHICEALAPTTERDFERLPKDRQRIYRALRSCHLHGSPDGPFFFIVARSLQPGGALQLVGITDSSMLRPQVFALHEGELQLGLIASEKQAIDAYLEQLSAADGRVAPQADRYWNARGGSHTDGGAFAFTTEPDGRIRCSDKFGRRIEAPAPRQQPPYPVRLPAPPAAAGPNGLDWTTLIEAAGPRAAYAQLARQLAEWDFDRLGAVLARVGDWGAADGQRFETALEFMTLVLDQRCDTGGKKPAAVRAMAGRAVEALLERLPLVGDAGVSGRVDVDAAGRLGPPPTGGRTLAVCARGFAPEGPRSVARLLVRGYRLGWRRFAVYGCAGDRFLGCGLGPGSDGVRIDVYGSAGDYLGSGLDGAEIHVHGDAQDQLGQILKRGRIVIHGHVGQTLLYGAKGGEVFVRGNAAGRPLINAVGDVRVVINGTCLDYAAESFMAGPTTGGGFLVINGVCNLDDGRVYGLETKYPGSNLFSLSSGGCCYLNDPYKTVSTEQLNGARFDPFGQDDWLVLEPVLAENQELFRIHTRHDVLMVDGVMRWPKEVFRKVVPASAPEPVE
jgi:glutamate synthase domain-containing protein 1/glutamate synthase domain-containing protein 3